MVKPLSLPTIQALADDTPYGGTRVLDSLSAATILSAANWLSDFGNWEGAGSELTTDEMDEIDALVGELVNDVLVGGTPEVGNFVKIDEVVYTADVNYPTITDMDTTDYDRLKIIVSGLLSNRASVWLDFVLMQLNEDSVATKYWSYAHYNVNGSSADYQYIGTVSGIKPAMLATADSPSSAIFGNAEITIYNNLSGEQKHIQTTCMLGSRTSNQLARIETVGVFNGAGPVDAITLFADVGTGFLIDTTDAAEPNELRITVYGLD